jgi:hypothetical protein
MHIHKLTHCHYVKIKSVQFLAYPVFTVGVNCFDEFFLAQVGVLVDQKKYMF